MSERAELSIGDERFTVADLSLLADLVATGWTEAADRDWSARAGTLEWSCLFTADHAVDCVYAPAFFLASRNLDAYPAAGLDLTLGPAATPGALVDSLLLATRMLAAVVNDAAPDVRAVIFAHPRPCTGAPFDFPPRAALELILHAHDIGAGLGVPFEPPADLCRRLRDHTRHWPTWAHDGDSPGRSADPWADLLDAAGRARSIERS